jgi:hypothetical protein
MRPLSARIIIRAMRLMASLVALFVLGGQTYPPPYPRPGTRALIDNARAQVWDVSWPKTTTPPGIHRHLYDMTGLYYWPGDRRITQPDGTTRNVTTEAGRIQWQLKGITHMEEGISDDPLRAVMIELKGDGPSGKVEKVPGVAAFAVSTMPLLDNERVTVWAYKKPEAAAKHSHPFDTVVVWTEGRVGHAAFITAGTVHTDEPIGAAAGATIFELK